MAKSGEADRLRVVKPRYSQTGLKNIRERAQWTAQEDAALTEACSMGLMLSELAEVFPHRPPGSIRNRASHLGLYIGRKPPEPDYAALDRFRKLMQG